MIELRQCDEWIAVYKDGKKVWENHSCGLRDGLEALDIPFTYVDLYDQVDECCGTLPDGSDPFPKEIPCES